MTTEPTDAELFEVIREAARGGAVRRDGSTSLRIARAALAKWGTPPAVAGEPVAYRHMRDDGWEYYDAPTGSDCPGCEPLYTTPQPAQPQAGAVPLTDGQIETESPKYYVENLLDFKIGVRFAERHYGIKGGQHGTIK